MKKHVEHKDTLKMMNDALKRQVDLVKEECELKLKVNPKYSLEFAIESYDVVTKRYCQTIY